VYRASRAPKFSALVLSFWDGFSAVMIAWRDVRREAVSLNRRWPSHLGSPLCNRLARSVLLAAFIDIPRLRAPCSSAWRKFFSAHLADGILARPYAAWAFVACIVLADVSANVTTASWVCS
jgi:hypothetical protein